MQSVSVDDVAREEIEVAMRGTEWKSVIPGMMEAMGTTFKRVHNVAAGMELLNGTTFWMAPHQIRDAQRRHHHGGNRRMGHPGLHHADESVGRTFRSGRQRYQNQTGLRLQWLHARGTEVALCFEQCNLKGVKNMSLENLRNRATGQNLQTGSTMKVRKILPMSLTLAEVKEVLDANPNTRKPPNSKSFTTNTAGFSHMKLLLPWKKRAFWGFSMVRRLSKRRQTRRRTDAPSSKRKWRAKSRLRLKTDSETSGIAAS